MRLFIPRSKVEIPEETRLHQMIVDNIKKVSDKPRLMDPTLINIITDFTLSSANWRIKR